MEFDIDAINHAHLERQRNVAPAEPTRLGITAAQQVETRWTQCHREVGVYEKWLPLDLKGAVKAVLPDQMPDTIDAVTAVRTDTFAVIVAILRDIHGDLMTAFIRLGRPLPLSRVSGASGDKWEPYEWDSWFLREENGWAHPEPAEDRRSRTVVEPATGMVWASAAELARAIDKPLQSLYHHLQGRAGYSKVAGRVFEYVTTPEKARPGSIDAMTEQEKEEARARSRAAGFEPRF